MEISTTNEVKIEKLNLIQSSLNNHVIRIAHLFQFGKLPLQLIKSPHKGFLSSK